MPKFMKEAVYGINKHNLSKNYIEAIDIEDEIGDSSF
jgi:hypothetical protein